MRPEYIQEGEGVCSKPPPRVSPGDPPRLKDTGRSARLDQATLTPHAAGVPWFPNTLLPKLLLSVGKCQLLPGPQELPGPLDHLAKLWLPCYALGLGRGQNILTTLVPGEAHLRQQGPKKGVGLLLANLSPAGPDWRLGLWVRAEANTQLIPSPPSVFESL